LDFIKRHYEKLILLLLLVIFIGSMFHVLNIVKETGEVEEGHLQIPTRDPDYQMHAPDNVIFNIPELLKSNSVSWVDPGPRKPADADHYSDLVDVFRIVRCPFCNKLIPRSYMEKKQVCPFCGNRDNGGAAFVVPPPPGEPVVLPPEIIEKYKLDPNDPDVANYDIDKDGFSNIYEYRMKTDLGDVRSHPPLWHRLRVIDVGKVELPVRLQVFNTVDSKDPKQWEFQIKNGKFSDLYMIGSEIEIEHKYYRIVKAERKVVPAPNGKGAGKDASVVYLQGVGEKRQIVMTLGVPVKSLEDKAILEDSANPEARITASVGDSFSLGNRLTGVENYRIKKFDAKEKTVLLENPAVQKGDATKDVNGTEMRVTTFGQVPFLMKVKIPRVVEGEPGSEGPNLPGVPPGSR